MMKCVNEFFYLFIFVAETRQTLLFSATLTKKTENLVSTALKKQPLYVGVDDNEEKATVDGLKQVSCLLICHLCSKIIVYPT